MSNENKQAVEPAPQKSSCLPIVAFIVGSIIFLFGLFSLIILIVGRLTTPPMFDDVNTTFSLIGCVSLPLFIIGTCIFVLGIYIHRHAPKTGNAEQSSNAKTFVASKIAQPVSNPQINFPLLEGEQILHHGRAYYGGMGQLYFTNKRLYFEASQTDNSSIMLDEIKYINETEDKSGFVATLKNDCYKIFITPSDRKWAKIILNFAPTLQEPPAVPKPEVPQKEVAYLLGHYLRETDRSNLKIGNATSTLWKEHYYTQTLPLRPQKGALKTTITCNTCSEQFTLKMVSKPILKAKRVTGFTTILVVLGLLSFPIPLLAPVPIGLLLGFIISRLFPKAYKNKDYNYFDFDSTNAFDGITLTPKGKSAHTHKLLI